MARQVLPWVGAAVGLFFGAPQIGFMIGSLIGNAVDPQVIKGPSIGDGQTQTSKEGAPRPIIYGTACVAGNIIDTSEIYKSIKENQQGKGGGPVVEEERMHMTYAIRICEGPVSGILRIWEDEKLVYDIRRGVSQVSADENTKYQGRFRVYLGGEDQLPDPELEVIHGAGNAPAYRGTCYIVFPRNDVTDRRGSIPSYRFEVAALGQVHAPPSLMLGGGGVFTGQPGQMVATSATGRTSLFFYSDFSRDNTFLSISYTYISVGSPWHQQRAIDIYKINENLTYDFFKTILCPEEGGGITFGRFSPTGRHMLIGWASYVSGNPTAISTNYATLNCEDESFDVISTFKLESSSPPGGWDASWSPSGSKFFVNLASSSARTYESIAIFSVTVNGIIDLINAKLRGVGDSLITTNLAWKPSETAIAGSTSATLMFFTVPDLKVYATGPIQTDGVVRAIYMMNTYYEKVLVYSSVNPGEKMIKVFDYVSLSSEIGDNFVESNHVISDFPVTTLYSDMSVEGTYLAIQAFGGGSSTVGGIGAKLYQIDNEWGDITFLQDLIVGFPTGTGNPRFSKTPISAIGDSTLDTVGNIIRDVTTRCKVDPSRINIDRVRDIPVRGLIVAQQYAANNTLRAMQNSFFFDPGEWDDKIHFTPRGGPIQKTFVIDDMIDDPYSSERKSAREYPRKIELMYQNATIGYDSAKQDVTRNDPSVQASGTMTMEVPVVLNETEAKQIADKQLKVAWAEADGDVILTVSTEHDYLTVTDIIGTVLRDVSRRVRIEKIERADGVLKITGKNDRQSAYTSRLTAPPLSPPRPPPPTITGVTQFAFLNIPALVDNNDVLGYYVAGTGSSQAWYGGIVERRILDEEYVQVATLPLGTTMGFLTQELHDASEHYPDTTNVINVQLYSGSFESVAMNTLLREENPVAICRTDGTAEVIQFKDALDKGNGLYELSYLVRGRLNTMTDTHPPGAKVVFLEDVRLIPADTTLIDQELTHRATSYGESPEDSTEHVHDWIPVMMQTEFPVDLLRLEKDGTTITASWSPRERFGSDIAPIRSVNWQHYLVTATNGSDTITAETTDATYTFTMSGTVSVTVQQVNRITGPGPGVSKTI